MPKIKKKVIVGMSGGVDSSVAALLLKKKGFLVEGLFMKNWDEDDGTDYCTAMQDLQDAEAVCKKLGIKLNTANFAPEYWENVFEEFLAEFDLGRTPNPDILCNREIKFKVFKDYADTLGADFIATGHYAKITHDNDDIKLMKGFDDNKDQTYFLSAVPTDGFQNVLFPIGDITKSKVRRIAAESGLITSNKKDSTGICFIGERRFSDFLKQYVSKRPGNIISEDNMVLGKHQGLMFFTIGQRQGIRVGGVKNTDEAPWYVLEKRLETNELVVGQKNTNPKLYTHKIIASKSNWINGKYAKLTSFKCAAKIRYRQADQECKVERFGDSYHVDFVSAQRAATPGQTVVFYDGSECLGGGVIDHVQPSSN